MSGTIFIISAPSGSGKSSLVNELRHVVPGLEFSISYTTRAPRGSEQNGREYFFVTREKFDAMLAADEFLEHAEVFGECYGTAKHFVTEALARGNDLVLDIDVQGAAQLKVKLPDAVGIFILPPSRKELEARLKRRNLSDHVAPEVIERRLKGAGKEIENFSHYDYILVNDNFETAVEQLRAIVLAERIRRSSTQISEENRAILEAAECCIRKNAMQRVQSILDSFKDATDPQP
ncbi:guanylate kinase [Candidatus Koribacter versatilis Ellin345]|uniref:Guanylate kinase n=1 Tax=Koribacter versatilis (strain Ellin345) TaxID=204669 RepID=KGUA_KORVE|nr:guanylate kinase [Candidatus Koribacter versatilis]Q1IK22.1 RecName: Full=Guanylate kinase; AltName: Full=GMP kinase [Candidatus Koribacter versatilis Ellin345]ABF42778.1 guanylate kinase [Candidatus Koribacter versatilis Ellin345]